MKNLNKKKDISYYIKALIGILIMLLFPILPHQRRLQRWAW